MNLPTLSPEFYERSENLQRIRAEAQAYRCPPDAVLGAVLCRLAALVPVTATVNGDSPNYFVALVGGSGSGKTTSTGCARRLIPEIGTDLDGLPVSSGEGLVQSYLQQEKVDGKLEQRQVHSAGFFYVDEGQSLLAQSERQGSTTLSTLRLMWAGEVAGTTGARAETTRRLSHDSYRVALLVGLQPDYASTLLADDHAGTPQRFLWLACRDPEPPENPPRPRGQLQIPQTISGQVRLGQTVERTIDRLRLDVLRNGGHSDPLRSQETVLHLRTGYLLAMLNGRPGEIDGDDWLAGLELVEHSRNVAHALKQIAQQKRREQNLEADAEIVERIQNRSEMKRQKDLDRIARNLARKVQNGEELKATELRRKLHERDRHLFDDAVIHACQIGLLRPTDGAFTAGALKP
jgi:energy-coupling factor transporter ATP-binding protein EcfA2